jgi:hypothetical protein
MTDDYRGLLHTPRRREPISPASRMLMLVDLALVSITAFLLIGVHAAVDKLNPEGYTRAPRALSVLTWVGDHLWFSGTVTAFFLVAWIVFVFHVMRRDRPRFYLLALPIAPLLFLCVIIIFVMLT